MLTSDLYSNLRKLNNGFLIKDESINRVGIEGYPIVGLYCNQKFLMAIPRTYIPEYSIAGVNLKRLERREPEKYKEAIKTGHCDNEKILIRGWKAIINSLVRQQYIDRNRTEKLFYRFHYEENRKEYPRAFIQMDI